MKFLFSILFFISLQSQGQLYFPAVIPQPLPPVTYYVSNDGDDDNDGLTPETAWQTIAKANSITGVTGSDILFNGGDTFTGNLEINRNGTDADKAIIGSYGVGTATISAGDGTAILINSKSHIAIGGIVLEGSGVDTDGESTNLGYGIYALSQSATHLEDIDIESCTISGFYMGILVTAGGFPSGGSVYEGFNNVSITYCDISFTAWSGILFWSTAYGNFTTVQDTHNNIYIGFTYVHDTYGNNSPTGTPTAGNPGTGIRITCATGILVEYSRTHNIGHMGVEGGGTPAGFEAENARDGVWQYLESDSVLFGSGTFHFDAAAFDIFDGNTQNMILQYSYGHDCDGYGVGGGNGGYGFANTGHIARFNVFVNNNISNDQADVYLWAENTDLKFYNNVVYSERNGTYLLRTNADVVNTTFANNIFVSKGNRQLGHFAGTITLLNNLYYSPGTTFTMIVLGTTYTSLAGLQGAGYEKIGGTTYGLVGNPLFVNEGANNHFLMADNVAEMTDYDLQAGSPALGTAVSFPTQLGTYPLIDFHGTTFSLSSFNIGPQQ